MTAPGIGLSRLSALHAVRDREWTNTIESHAMTIARAHGLDADAVERAGLVTRALSENIALHAGAGHVALRPVGEAGTGCVEILAFDKGPGIADISRAMRAVHRSDVPGPEHGLAAVRRASTLFDIYSQPGRGTAVVAHVGGADTTCAASELHQCIGVVCAPLLGEQECGDDWAVEIGPSRMVIMLVDGLGHGPGAAAAALAATSAFPGVVSATPERMLARMHDALHDTRGAALSVTVIDRKHRTARFCGVGNVDGRVLTSDAAKQQLPQSGIVGHTMPRVQASNVDWPKGARLVLHSDGISSRWRADAYPGLLARHPSLLAAVIFRDFARDHDDSSVLVVRDCIPSPAT